MTAPILSIRDLHSGIIYFLMIVIITIIVVYYDYLYSCHYIAC